MRILILTILFLSGVYNATAQFTATITSGGPTTFCLGDSVYLIANANADTYQWMTNGTPIMGANNDTLIVNAGGNYEVAVDSAGYSDTSVPETVIVNTVPAQPGPITGNTAICSDATETYSVPAVPGATSYTWYKYSYFGTINTTTVAPSFTGVLGDCAWGTTPDADLVVIANNSCGSSMADTLQLEIYTKVNLGGMNQNTDLTDLGLAYCPTYIGQPTTLFANWHPDPGGYSTATSYEWFRNGVPIGGNSQTLAIDRGGNYSVKIYCGVCPVELIKNPLPQCAPRANIYPQTPVTICIGSNVTLNVDMDLDGYSGNGFSWFWELNGTMIPGSNNLYSITPTSPGMYEVNLQVPACSSMAGLSSCYVYGLYQPPPVTVSFSNFIAPNVTVTQTGNVLTATPGFNSYQWYRNGVLIPGANSDTYTITIPGSHTVVVNDGNMCTAMYRMSLGIENLSGASFDMIIYPSPNEGIFNIAASIPHEDRTAQLTITDITGRAIFRKDIHVQSGTIEKQLEIDSSYPPGLYFLKLSTERFTKTTSFVKQ